MLHLLAWLFPLLCLLSLVLLLLVLFESSWLLLMASKTDNRKAMHHTTTYFNKADNFSKAPSSVRFREPDAFSPLQPHKSMLTSKWLSRQTSSPRSTALV